MNRRDRISTIASPIIPTFTVRADETAGFASCLGFVEGLDSEDE